MNQIVVAVTKRSERGPIKNRVLPFQVYSARRTVDLKARIVSQGLDLHLRLENLAITSGCLSSGEDISW